MITNERVALVAVLVVISSTFFFLAAPQRSTADNNNISTSTQLHLWGKKDGASGTLKIKTTKTIMAGTDLLIDVDNNVVSEPKKQTAERERIGVDLSYQRNRSFIDPAYSFPFTDLGAFAAVIPSSSVDDLVVGLRTSPVRLVYGTFAPDVLFAQHYVGVGLSMYAPQDIMGGVFAHWGIGAGHFWSVGDKNDEVSANAIYISFSTKLP